MCQLPNHLNLAKWETNPLLVNGQLVAIAPRGVGLDKAGLVDGALYNALADAAAGLGYLHTSGWVHLDLKPSNILVVDGRAKLADFGYTVQTRMAVRRLGDRRYTSPEAIAGYLAGQLTVVESWDLWALGLTIYAFTVDVERDERAMDYRLPAAVLKHLQGGEEALRHSHLSAWMNDPNKALDFGNFQYLEIETLVKHLVGPLHGALNATRIGESLRAISKNSEM